MEEHVSCPHQPHRDPCFIESPHHSPCPLFGCSPSRHLINLQCARRDLYKMRVSVLSLPCSPNSCNPWYQWPGPHS